MTCVNDMRSAAANHNQLEQAPRLAADGLGEEAVERRGEFVDGERLG